MIGAYSAGVLGGHQSRKFLLSGIYFSRAVAFSLFLIVPTTPFVVIVFSIMIGLLWLSTVPLTSGLVALMFGTRHVGMLFGFVFLSHQIGAFIGVWLGGVIYDATGGYDLMWWLAVALGLFAAVVHLPIHERKAPQARRRTRHERSRLKRELGRRPGAWSWPRSAAATGRRSARRPSRPTAGPARPCDWSVRCTDTCPHADS